MIKKYFIISLLLLALPIAAAAQDEPDNQDQSIRAEVGGVRQTLIDRPITFDITPSTIPEGSTIKEVFWDFGDGIQSTGEKVSHVYLNPGSYSVKLKITTDEDSAEDSAEVRVFKQGTILIVDSSAPEDQIELHQQQASKAGLLLITLRSKGSGPEVLTEEELTRQLIDVRDTLADVELIVTWTSGGVGANVLSKFSQHINQKKDLSLPNLLTQYTIYTN